MHWRNPNNPTLVGTIWPHYTADTEEYLGLSLNLTVRSKMRPDKMAFWNELVPSIEETIAPTTTSHIPTTTEQIDDKKGMSTWNLTLFTIISPCRFMWSKIESESVTSPLQTCHSLYLPAYSGLLPGPHSYRSGPRVVPYSIVAHLPWTLRICLWVANPILTGLFWSSATEEDTMGRIHLPR